MSRFPAAARHLPALLLGLSLVLALVAAATGARALTVAAVTLSILLEVWLGGRALAGALPLEQAGLGRMARFLLRVVAVTLVSTWTPALVVAFLIAVALF